DPSSEDVSWSNALQLLWFGLAFTPMTVLACATLPASRLTAASGVFTQVRKFGSSLYISHSVVLLIRSSAANYARLIEAINPFNLNLNPRRVPEPERRASRVFGKAGSFERLLHAFGPSRVAMR